MDLNPDQREDLIDAIAETMSDTCDMDVSFTQHARAIVGMLEKRGALQPAEASADMEKLAAWMVQNSFATGHGDTMEDLLGELAWQIKELREPSKSAQAFNLSITRHIMGLIATTKERGAPNAPTLIAACEQMLLASFKVGGKVAREGKSS